MRSPYLSRLTIGAIRFFIILFAFQVNAQLPFPDTLWVPVIFYDYHADGRADFETCEDPNSDVGQKGMVMTALDAQRKPVPVLSVACPTDGTAFPCACNLSEWFKISGKNETDNTCLFQCDSVTNPDRPIWSWTNLVPYQSRSGEYTGPNYDADYPMANVVIYDSLAFSLVPNSDGVYEFINDEFFPLDDRGFGNEPTWVDELHNFGFTMELHTKFKYKKGLTFRFRGDDDVWAFINDELVMDLGGLHHYMDGFIDLDTIADLVEGETYNFDLYYAERHSTGSHIRINSNVISATPSEVHISVFPSDTMKAGDTALVVGTVTDENGETMPIQSKSISWTQYQENVEEGDQIITPVNDTTKFTATVAYRRIGIIGTFKVGNNAIIDTAWLYIKPADPSQIDIIRQSTTALTRSDVVSQTDTFTVAPRQTVTLTMGQNSAYAYAVVRDRFDNFCYPADASVWTSQNTAAATVNYTANSAFEGVIGRPAGVQNASTMVIVSQGELTPDTADVQLFADTVITLRLIDITTQEVVPDTIFIETDSTRTVKLQGTWSNSPDTWVDLTGIWTLDPSQAITFTVPLPEGEAGTWAVTPSTAGEVALTVTSHRKSVAVYILSARSDLIAPYIQKAIFTTGMIGTVYDTLQVFFSEPISCRSLKSLEGIPATSFKVIGPGDSVKTDAFDGAYYLDNSKCPDRFITEVTIITKVNIGRIIPDEDSLLLFGSAMDTAGNHPDTTRPGPIIYGPGAGISIIPIRNNNPSRPMEVPPGIVLRFNLDEHQTEGKVIFIQTRRPLLPLETLPDGTKSYGRMLFYDAVGNIVAVDKPVKQSPLSDRLYTVFWDCRNLSKRKVGNGAYLFRTSVVYDDDVRTPKNKQGKLSIRW